ncbi:MAG TPA: prephenate dehydratase [Desulfonauticus sp.]|nr:MAG: Prephenate dehydratase [Desulfonauticus sp. 38_4375]HCO12280.1 prephenate dehydratase [Desulfonauticus sp.]
MNLDRLKEIRTEINKLDLELLKLLNQRAELSLEVGKIKAQDKDLVFKPFREREVLKNLEEKNTGPLPTEHLRAIYREILSSSRRLQSPQKVYFLGPEGTFSHLAGMEYLGQSADFRPQKNIEAVFKGVVFKEADLGIIPLENSLQGSVGQSLDYFMRYEVYIQAEIYFRISHFLLSKSQSLKQIKRVYSHPQALEQCDGWLNSHLPLAEIIPERSTAQAAKRVTQEEESAAIGHKKLAELLHLNILASHIEDLSDNWTRFLIIANQPAEIKGKEKTSIVFTLPDKPGSLSTVLEIFARAKINLKKLESRPLRGEKWQYVFFADVECDLTREEYKELLTSLKNNCHLLKVLGSYPKGEYLGS